VPLVVGGHAVGLSLMLHLITAGAFPQALSGLGIRRLHQS
jgi:hypothetical protein